MENNFETDYTSPNLRFGSSFLNTKFRDRAVDDEVMMDKSTGSISYKRPDGSFMSYDRENISVNDMISQMKMIYSSNKNAVYPTKVNSNAYDNTYLMGIQFDLQDFAYVNPYVIRFEDGAILENPNKTPINISHEMNGFFIQAMVRPRDISIINLLSSVYDRFFKSYTGTDENFIEQKEIFEEHPEYEGKTVRVHYTVTYFKDEVPIDEISEDGYGKIQEMCYIPFSNTEICSRDDVDYITFSIDKIDLPKIYYANEIKETEFTNDELEFYDALKDNQDIGLKYLNIVVYSTITDKIYYNPINDNISRVLVAINMNTVDEMVNETIGGMLQEVSESVKEEMPDDLLIDGNKIFLTVKGTKVGDGQKLPGGTIVGTTAPTEKSLTSTPFKNVSVIESISYCLKIVF